MVNNVENVLVIKAVKAPKDRVWEVLDNFQGVGAFHPSVKAVSLISENNEGLGAERICHFYNGSNFNEKVTRYVKGKEMDVSILSGLPGMMDGTPYGTLSLEEIDNNTTQVSMRMNFKVKYGILGKLIARTMMKSQFRKLLSGVLDGLDHHSRTGEIIGKGGKVLTVAEAEVEQAEAPKILATIMN